MHEKARNIKLVLSDCDGVLTDTGVYYSAEGEQLKRFSIRDGMGVERLKNLVGVETGIVTGEISGSVVKRAEKLKITELHLAAKDKISVFNEILQRRALAPDEVAYIGDDVNDLEVLKLVGFSACPADAMPVIRDTVDYVCSHKGGHGAFREMAEFIVAAKTEH